MGETRERGVRATNEGKLKLQQAKGAKCNNDGKRWTHSDIANAAKVDEKTVQRFLGGRHIDVSIATNVCQVLGVNASEVLESKDKDKKGQLGSDPCQETTDSQSAPQNESSSETISIDELVKTARDNIGADIKVRCGTMRVIGMNKPIEVDDIYISVNILEKITKTQWSSTEELLQNANSKNFDRFSLAKVSEEKVPGLEAVGKYSKLMILGKPGAGKTTFLKHVALQCIEGKFEPSRIPLFVTLKDFAEADGQLNLLKYLTQLLTSESIESQAVEQLVKQGRLLVLLDGLDEVQKADYERIRNQIKNFTLKYYQNQFVITCRIAAREYIFDNFTDIEIDDFDFQQIKVFAKKWFAAKNDVSKVREFISELERNKRITELANSPLLLTLLCLLFEQKGIFPQSRAGLYEEGLDLLLVKWDESRGVDRDQLPYKDLSPEQRKDLLMKIAYPKFEDGKYFFKPEDVEQYIKQSLHIKDNINTKKVLESIEAQHGLLVERARGIYSFSHLTFHEYFTARKIKEVGDDEILRDLCTHITETRWLEVFLLVARLIGDKADQLLLFMEQKTLSYINTNKLQELLRWADKETAGSMGDTKPYGKRALAIAHAYDNAHVNARYTEKRDNLGLSILTYGYNDANGSVGTHAYADAYANANAYPIANDYAYPIAIAIANANANANGIAIVKAIAKAISIAHCNAYPNGRSDAETIDTFMKYAHHLENLKIFKNIDLTGLIDQMKALKIKTQIFDYEQRKYAHKSEAKHFFEIWLHAFNLTPEMVNLSEQEIKALKNYLYANRLILECKKLAVRVTPSTWEEIEERMLKFFICTS